MQIDHPLLRQHSHCPLCHERKDQGLVTCWPCYRRHELKYGNARAEAIIDRAETGLMICDRLEASR